jgi:hypothetical protein
VRAVRSSPQRRKAWLKEVAMSLEDDDDAANDIPLLMLILDVKTRWSSTHQMLREFNFFLHNILLCLKML